MARAAGSRFTARDPAGGGVGRDAGERLLFLICLPRSGSTLLQRILGAHSRIATTAEPWLLLPPLYALRPGGLVADYDARVGQIGLTDFLSRMPNGEQSYLTAVGALAEGLYHAFLEQAGKDFFLDKTSRLYRVLPEISRIFPRARFVVLVRNPLAVLHSYVHTLAEGDYARLAQPALQIDLLQGYARIRDGVRILGDRAIVVRYEDLVLRSEGALARVCAHLRIEVEPSMLRLGMRPLFPGTLVDPKSVDLSSAVVARNADAWRTGLPGRSALHFAWHFLRHLGPELLRDLGYDESELAAGLSGREPRVPPLLSWNTVMRAPSDRTLLQRLWWRGLAFRGARRATRREEHAASTYPRVTTASSLREEPLFGWDSPSVAARQERAYQVLLAELRAGRPRQDLSVAIEALRGTGLEDPTLVEIGCGSGYYAEVLEHAIGRPIHYLGIDSSLAMIEAARRARPTHAFAAGDAVRLPFPDSSFDVAWSGTVLMHVPDYAAAIAETARVARGYCVFHSTPLLEGPAQTLFLSKRAYGGLVAEVLVNRREFESLLSASGLAIVRVLDSLPYEPGLRNVPSPRTLTYLCRKVR